MTPSASSRYSRCLVATYKLVTVVSGWLSRGLSCIFEAALCMWYIFVVQLAHLVLPIPHMCASGWRVWWDLNMFTCIHSSLRPLSICSCRSYCNVHCRLISLETKWILNIVVPIAVTPEQPNDDVLSCNPVWYLCMQVLDHGTSIGCWYHEHKIKPA